MSSPGLHPRGFPPAVRERIQARLRRLYGAQAEWLAPRVERLAAEHLASGGGAATSSSAPAPAWDQSDAVLITYADQVRAEGQTPLQALCDLVDDLQLQDLVSVVHLLPFFPYSSDDGFAVIDYCQVDPAVGDWRDIGALGRRLDLMFDLVLNHISSQSPWFQSYLRGEAPWNKFFIEADPSDDLSDVVRPRSLPLLTPCSTSQGRRHVWTTFSDDQVDLNYAEPQVLLEMLRVLLFYVSQGARIVRLDAIAYLWKRPGTSCIHLPETHEVVRLMRDVLEAAAPGVLLLTETNVPHRENISYFGDGDEAQTVYQFSLPPLLLEALHSRDATAISTWLQQLAPPPAGCTFFNFTASHDGVGVRPLEGLVPEERVNALLEHVRSVGGLVSMRRRDDGADSPYELNVSYVDAVRRGAASNPSEQAERFLATQAVMLALQGIPGIYFHSLVGTENDLSGAASSGMPRRINRRKFQRGELDQRLQREGLSRQVYQGYRQLLQLRRRQAAFHPEAEQAALEMPFDDVFAVQRRAAEQTILLACNVGDQPREIAVPAEFSQAVNLLDSRQVAGGKYVLPPGRAAWLTEDPAPGA